MKKIKSLSCILLAVLLVFSVFTVSVSALEPTAASTNLIVTKYQIKQMNGETTKIGNTDTLTGTTADAPTGYDVLSGVEFKIFKLGGMDTYVANSDVAAIANTYDATADTVTYKGNAITASATEETGDDGKATFNVTKENFGLYLVIETAAPANVTAKSAPFVVQLPKTNVDGDGFLTDTYVYPKNYTTLGGGILQKIDSSQNNMGLAGAQFAVYNKVTGEQVTADFYGNAIGDATNHYLPTDANGYVYVNNLLPGTYYFQEMVAPQGYILRSTKYEFTVVSGKSTEVVPNGDGTYTYEGITLQSADNSGKPQINKYVNEVPTKTYNTSFDEEVTWIIISDVPSDMGSKYTKYDITDTMSEELVFVDNSVKVETSTNGTTYSEITTGFTAPTSVDGTEFKVTFTDRTALAGVKKIKVTYNTTLDQAKTVMGQDIPNNVRLDYSTDAVTEYDVEEVPPTVYTDGFKFSKVSIDGTTTLDGAVFDVYAADGKTKVRTGVTSANGGQFEVKGLKDGTYYLRETKAPAKHELLTADFKFDVYKGSYDATTTNPVMVTNVPTPDIPLTGGIGTAVFTGVGLSLIALAVVLFVISRKTKKAN